VVPDPEKKYISIAFVLNHPLSRGTIVSYIVYNLVKFFKFTILQHAKTKDPLDQPEIDPHYFEHDFGNGMPSSVPHT